MVKTVKIFIFFLILVTIFNQQIVSNISLHFLSKWVERKVSVDDFKISYKDGIITMKNVKIQNPSKFYYKNFVHLNKIVLDYNLKTVFSKLIVINNLTFEKPKFYLEVIEGPSVELSPFNVQKMYDDNVGGVKKIVKSEPEKIWPKKKKRY